MSAVTGSDVRAGGAASPPFRAGPGGTGSRVDGDWPARGIAARGSASLASAPGPGRAGPWASQAARPEAARTGSWYRQPPPAPASATARSASYRWLAGSARAAGGGAGNGAAAQAPSAAWPAFGCRRSGTVVVLAAGGPPVQCPADRAGMHGDGEPFGGRRGQVVVAQLGILLEQGLQVI